VNDHIELEAVEILLCTAQRPDNHWCSDTTHQVADEIGLGRRSDASLLAAARWNDVDNERPTSVVATHNELALEAAYRLIESSPTLRREFFGRGAR
jgi:hypothetical protein